MTDDNNWYEVHADLEPELTSQVQALALWQSKRGDREFPSRADFTIEDLKPFFGWVTITEIEHDPFRIKYRLIGTKITTLANRDVTGRYLDEVYSPEVYGELIKGYRAVLERRMPVRVTARYRHIEKDYLSIDSLLAPLSNDGKSIDMIIIFEALSKGSL